MSRETIFQAILKLVEEQKGEQVALSLETSLEDGVAEDSVEFMEFVLNLEDTFGVEIPDASLDTFSTLEDIVLFIEESKQNIR